MGMFDYQTRFIDQNYNGRSSSLITEDTEQPQQQQTIQRQDATITPQPGNATTPAQTNGEEKKEDDGDTQIFFNEKDDVPTVPVTFSSGGHQFTFNIPTTHKIVEQPPVKKGVNVYTEDIYIDGTKYNVENLPSSHKPYNIRVFKTYERSHQALKKFRAFCTRGRFQDASELTRTLLATALVGCPSFALSTLAYAIPLLMYALLQDCGLFEFPAFDLIKYSKSFPSETHMRELIYKKAAACTVSLRARLVAMLVFLASDKGNKKGMDHLVKYVSYWCLIDRCVKTYLLDIDVTAGCTEDCGDAIANSLSVVGCKGNDTDTFKLRGSSSDSGGAGTGDGLADALKARKLTHQILLIVGCSIHCLQLQLSRPITELMGDGGLDKQNVMQMLHSAYDLQEALNWSELQRIIAIAAPEVASILSESDDVQDERDHFRVKMDHVKTFRDFTECDSLWPKKINADTGEETTRLRKLPAPILTRWHTVGATATAVWHSYVLLFQCLQIVINIHGSRVAGKIASGMMPLMVQPELFSDLALIHCYHQCYFTPQMSWMMECNDLTKPGFQSHQMLIRYYLMNRKMQVMEKGIVEQHHPKFDAFRATLSITGVDREVQVTKANGFISEAVASLEKHFLRWGTQELLPAALLSEGPYARVVARIILGREPMMYESAFDHSRQSPVHKDIVNTVFFEKFARSKFNKTLALEGIDFNTVDRSTLFPPEVTLAAEALLSSDEETTPNITSCQDVPVTILRDIKEPTPTHYQIYLWQNYLPLASQTQFVESGVKEASNVSKTGRSEELRSGYAIVRSYLMHNSSLSKMSAPSKFIHFVRSAIAFHDRQEHEENTIDGYADDIKEAMAKLRNDHFKKKREQELIDKVTTQGLVLRKENERQQRSGVDRTNVILKQTPHSAIKKGNPSDPSKTHIPDIIKELKARDCPQDLIDGFVANKWTSMKAWLKKHEKERVRLEGKGAILNAEKAFKPQSDAKFKSF